MHVNLSCCNAFSFTMVCSSCTPEDTVSEMRVPICDLLSLPTLELPRPNHPSSLSPHLWDQLFDIYLIMSSNKEFTSLGSVIEWSKTSVSSFIINSCQPPLIGRTFFFFFFSFWLSSFLCVCVCVCVCVCLPQRRDPYLCGHSQLWITMAGAWVLLWLMLISASPTFLGAVLLSFLGESLFI